MSYKPQYKKSKDKPKEPEKTEEKIMFNAEPQKEPEPTKPVGISYQVTIQYGHQVAFVPDGNAIVNYVDLSPKSQEILGKINKKHCREVVELLEGNDELKTLLRWGRQHPEGHFYVAPQ